MTIGQDFSDTMYYTRYAYVAEQIGKTFYEDSKNRQILVRTKLSKYV